LGTSICSSGEQSAGADGIRHLKFARLRFRCRAAYLATSAYGADEHLAAISRLIEPLEYVSTSPEAARWAGDSRLRRHQDGRKLGLGDALIAGTAVAIGATVVTRNRPDFERQGVPVLTY